MDNFNLIEFLAKNPLREAEASDLEKSYKKDVPQFVDDLKQYAKDPKVSAILKAGQADGDPNDDKLPYTQTSVKVGGLIPTQNEIDFNKSVLHILDDQFGSLSSILNGKANVGNPIVTYNGKWIIDGHHRWSQVLAANPNAKMDALDIKGNLPPEDVLKAVHGAIAATTGKVPSSSVGEGSMNVLSASDDAVRANLEKLINDPSNFPSKAEALWREKGFDSKEKIVNYIANNLKSIRQQGHIQKAPGRISMPQTDADGAIKDKLDALAKGNVNISPPFVTENIKKNMNDFNLKNFINENKLGAYSLLKENKYFTTDEDGDEILNLDLASEYLAQTHDEEDVDAFFSDDEVFEDLPYDSEEFPTEESVEGALENAFELYSGGGDVFEKLDPVGKEDSDINNDGKVDKTDKYLANRRKAVSKATKNEAVGGEMAEILGAFLALVGAGKTALEAVKILGDEHGDISISSIKDAIKQYKASKKIGEELSDEEADKFHTKLDNLVHKTFGPSSDEKDMNEELDEKYDREDGDGHLGTNTDDDFEREQLAQLAARNEDFDIGYEDDEPSMLKNKMYRASKLASMLFDKLDNYDDMATEVDFPDWWQAKLSKAKDMLQSAYDYLDGEEGVAQADAMNEEVGMEYEYDDIVGPLMQNMVKMKKWVAQNASDDTEAVQLLQLATNAVENFDNYMAYGTEMNEEVKGDFKIGDKVTYLGHPGEVTNVERQMTGATTYSVAYDKGQGRTKVTGIYNKGGEIKPMKENSLNLSDAL